MKTKDQKRREAIERLERAPRRNSTFPQPEGWTEETWSKRRAAARGLREKFGYEQQR